MASGYDCSQRSLFGLPPPTSARVQVRAPVQVRVAPVPQQGSPAPPHGSQVPVRHTRVSVAQVPLLPPQHDWPLAPQAMQVALAPLPVHTVFAAVHSRLFPQHG